MTAVSRKLLVAVLLIGWSQAASAQTADEVIEKHLAAIGGRAALTKLESRLMVGTITLSTPGGDVTGPIETLNQYPNKQRTLIKLDLSALGAGEVAIDQRFDGTSGYVLDSLQGNRDITGSQLENMRNAMFPTPFLNYKENGVSVELKGKAKVGERDGWELIFKPRTGPTVRQFVDAESYLPLRLVVSVQVPQMGELEQTTDFLDQREVDGVKIPFLLKSSSAVQSFTITITKVEHNGKVDDALFRKPADR